MVLRATLTTVPSSITIPDPSVVARTTPRPAAEAYCTPVSLIGGGYPGILVRSSAAQRAAGDPGDVVGGVLGRADRVDHVREHQPDHHVDRGLDPPLVQGDRVGTDPGVHGLACGL